MARTRVVNASAPIEVTPEPFWVKYAPTSERYQWAWKWAGGFVCLLLLMKFTTWKIVFVLAVAYGLTYFFEKWRRNKTARLILEVRLQGQYITNVPKPFTVPTSGVRIWSVPQDVFERLIVFGDHRPPMNTNGLLVADFVDARNQVVVFPDDSVWSNFTFLTHANDDMAQYFRQVMDEEKALQKVREHAAMMWSNNKLAPEEALAIITRASQQQRNLAANPKTFRNLFIYYKDTIPHLQHLLVEVEARFEEKAHQMGVAYALMLNGMPLRPEIVKGLPLQRGDYDRLVMKNPRYDEDDVIAEDTGLAAESGAEPIQPGEHTIGMRPRMRMR